MTQLTSPDMVVAFREGVQAGIESITGCPPIEDREAFRELRRRVTPSGVSAHGLSNEAEKALLGFMDEARDVADAVLDRLVAEYVNEHA